MPNVTLTPAQIAGYAQGAGFSGSNLVMAVAIALAESGGQTWAIDNDSDGSQDQGVWQINTVHESEFPGMTRDPGTGGVATAGTSIMFDPATNAAAAFTLSSHGSNFTAWSTYNNGDYAQFVGQATTASGNPTSPSTGPPASSQAAAAGAAATGATRPLGLGTIVTPSSSGIVTVQVDGTNAFSAGALQVEGGYTAGDRVLLFFPLYNQMPYVLGIVQ
jgi:hypothetical protein